MALNSPFVLDFTNKILNAEINGTIYGHRTKGYPNKTGTCTFGNEYYQYRPKNYSNHNTRLDDLYFMFAPSLSACPIQHKAHKIAKNTISNVFISFAERQ